MRKGGTDKRGWFVRDGQSSSVKINTDKQSLAVAPIVRTSVVNVQ